MTVNSQFRRSLQALEAAKRLHAQDCSGANGIEMFVAASGGYGAKARNQVLADIRTLIDAQLEPVGAPYPPRPSGFDAA